MKRIDIEQVQTRVYVSSDRLFDRLIRQCPEVFPLHVLMNADEAGDIGIDKVPYLATGLIPEINEHYLFFLAWDADMETVIGSIVVRYGMDDNSMRKGDNWICSIGVNKDYVGNGIARRLAKECFEFCRKAGIKRLEQSSYTTDGERLMGMFDRLSDEAPWLEFVDPKTRM